MGISEPSTSKAGYFQVGVVVCQMGLDRDQGLCPRRLLDSLPLGTGPTLWYQANGHGHGVVDVLHQSAHAQATWMNRLDDFQFGCWLVEGGWLVEGVWMYVYIRICVYLHIIYIYTLCARWCTHFSARRRRHISKTHYCQGGYVNEDAKTHFEDTFRRHIKRRRIPPRRRITQRRHISKTH